MNEQQLNFLKSQLETLRDFATKSEFLAFSKALTQLIVKAQAQVNERNAKINKEIMKLFDDLQKNTSKEHKDKMDAMMKELKSAISKMHEEHRAGMNLLYDKAAEIKNGSDGEDGHTPTTEELLALIEPLIPKQKEEKEITISDIKGLDEYIQDRIPKKSGGGVTNLRIIQAFKTILKTEAPSGAINGSNTVYTVTQPIFAVLAFSLNGETIAQLPNYTIAGNKITFASALPASYSGKDFEVKYI